MATNNYKVKNLLKRLEKANQFLVIYKDYPDKRDEIIEKASPLIKRLISEGVSPDSARLFFYLGNNPDHNFLQENRISIIGNFSETEYPLYVSFQIFSKASGEVERNTPPP